MAVMTLGLQRVRARAHLERCGYSGDAGAALDFLDPTLHLDENLKEMRRRLGLKSPEEVAEEEGAARRETEAAEVLGEGEAAVLSLVEERDAARIDEAKAAARVREQSRAISHLWDQITALEKRPAPGPGSPQLPWAEVSRILAIAEGHGLKFEFPEVALAFAERWAGAA